LFILTKGITFPDAATPGKACELGNCTVLKSYQNKSPCTDSGIFH